MILKLSAVSLGFMLLLPSVSAQSQDSSVEGRPEFVEPIVTTRLVSAQVQAPAPPADAASLLKRVELLEQQLAATNTQLAATIAELQAVKAGPVKNPDASLGSTSTPAPEDAANQVAASNSDRGPGAINLAGIHVRVFGDVRLQGTDAKGDKPAFRMDDLDLFFNARLSDQFSALTDVNFHFKDNFSVNPIIDRILLKYQYNENLAASIGRFHTGIGYFNDAFHQGRWLATAVDRPLFLEFSGEGGILPDRMVGLSFAGSMPSGALGLNYLAQVGSTGTQRVLITDEEDFIDEGEGLGFNLGLIAKPRSLPGLQAGFSFFRDRMSPVTSGGDALPNLEQEIYAAHALYQTPRFEFLNEVLLVRHALQDGSGLTFRTPAFYSLLSRRFGVVRPYVRYQYINASDHEPLFSDLRRRNGPSLGIRYDFNENAAFKAQYDRIQSRGQDATNGIQLQVDFMF
ncbi:MAG: hypothetical protein WB562_09905 [Candidatus Sulfotelmatobacter sp.]